MSQRNIGYWVVTGLFCLVYLGSGTADILHADRVVMTLAHLGYPAYVASVLGVWKIGAVIALLAPGIPRVKEWAYAGAVFDLTGALASHAFTRDPAVPFMLIPIVLLGLLVTSYLRRPASRTLEAHVAAETVG